MVKGEVKGEVNVKRKSMVVSRSWFRNAGGREALGHPHRVTAVTFSLSALSIAPLSLSLFHSSSCSLRPPVPFDLPSSHAIVYQQSLRLQPPISTADLPIQGKSTVHS